MPYNDEARKVLLKMMKNLENMEADEFLLLSKKWGVVIRNLEGLLQKLAEKEFLTKNQLYKDTLYQEFLREASAQVAWYDRTASGIILEHQLEFARIGTETTTQIINLAVRFNGLDPNKINVMIGLTKDDSPLFALLQKSYPKTVEKLVDTLITSQALGRSPIETARLMAVDMGGNRTRAMLIARTEQLRANREASIMTMKESGVCRGWIRIEEGDACDECKEANGKKYKLDEPFDTHPNCRGASLPDVGH